MASFEVQRYAGGDWQPHSDFDDKGFAIEAAKDLMSGGRAPGAVRVVEVLDGERPPRTVFRQSALDEHNTRTRRERFELVRDVEAARAARKQQRAARRVAAARQPGPSGRRLTSLLMRILLAATVLSALTFAARADHLSLRLPSLRAAATSPVSLPLPRPAGPAARAQRAAFSSVTEKSRRPSCRESSPAIPRIPYDPKSVKRSRSVYKSLRQTYIFAITDIRKSI